MFLEIGASPTAGGKKPAAPEHGQREPGAFLLENVNGKEL